MTAARRRWRLGPLVLLAALVWVAAAAVDDGAVMHAIREAVLTVSQEPKPSEAELATAEASHCCLVGTDIRHDCPANRTWTCVHKGWNANLSGHYCDWAGVGCNPDGRVVTLNLPKFDVPQDQAVRLSTQFVEHIAHLTALEELELTQHSVFHQPTELPASWARLTRLRRFIVEFAKFSGGLPPAWGSKTAFSLLETLSLTGCHVRGPIPDSWLGPGAFRSLQMLNLEGNALSGPLPAQLPNALLFLKDLNLNFNRFNGSLPSTWASATLARLDIGRNRLSGTLPDSWVDALPALESLQLDRNSLSGGFPTAWQGLRHLQRLWLFDNRLQGTLAGEMFCNGAYDERFPALLELDVSSNRLNGSLPGCWDLTGWGIRQGSCGVTGNPSRLESLILNNNAFSGTLPAAFPCTFPTLMRLDVSANALTGTVPPSWWGASTGVSLPWGNLHLLNVAHNRLDGRLPPDFLMRKLPWLPLAQTLDLSGNLFTGPLPPLPAYDVRPTLERRLRDLDLSGCLFTGTLPASWAHSTALRGLFSLNLSGNAFIGTLPTSWLDSDNFRPAYIDVSRNKLRGPLSIIPRGNNTPITLMVSPGNKGLCTSRPRPAAPAVCVSTIAEWSGVVPDAMVYTNVSTILRAHYANSTIANWPGCSPDDLLHLPECGAALHGGIGGHRWLLVAMLVFVAVGVLVFLLAHRRKRLHRFRQIAATVEDGVQLLPQLSSSSSDGSSRPRRRAEHAVIERRLRELQAEGLLRLADELLPSTSTAEVIAEAALAFGPLNLQLGDLVFLLRPAGSSGSGLHELGVGTSSLVYLARLFGTHPVAVKVMLLPAGPLLAEQLQQEVSLLHRCRHPGLLQVVGVTWLQGLVFVVTEVMGGGSLLSQIANPQLRYYDKGRDLLQQVATALQHLHASNIVHLDIKSSNVLLSASLCVAKICDLGKSGILQAHTITSRGLSTRYSSPEQLAGGRCGPPSDMYSFGILALEVLIGRAASSRNAQAELQLRVPEHCPMQVAELVNACLSEQAGKRPTADDLVAALRESTAAPVGAADSAQLRPAGDAAGAPASHLDTTDESRLLPLQVDSEFWQQVRLRIPKRT